MKDLYERYKDQGLVLIGVHTKNASERMAAFAKEQKIGYPIAIDAEGKTVKAFHVDSFPDYYVIGRGGKLRFADLANAELDAVVKKLLKEKPPKSAQKPKSGTRKKPIGS